LKPRREVLDGLDGTRTVKWLMTHIMDRFDQLRAGMTGPVIMPR